LNAWESSLRFIVTGTDTGIGKTVFSAALAEALDALYWKPIQSGLDGETDSECVQRLSGLPREKILPEAYRLALPASPHISARREGVRIDPATLSLPEIHGALVVEGAGGVLVPVTDDLLYADVFASWKVPAVLCARTALGTINHTLLSIEALRKRGIAIHGVAFIGDPEPEAEATITAFSGIRRLGRLPFLDPLNQKALAAAFAANFDIADFTMQDAS
jgi:dethiobiotin synthetase